MPPALRSPNRESHPKRVALLIELDFGEPPGTRTPNRVIKSHLLCQIELAAHQTTTTITK